MAQGIHVFPVLKLWRPQGESPEGESPEGVKRDGNGWDWGRPVSGISRFGPGAGVGP